MTPEERFERIEESHRKSTERMDRIEATLDRMAAERASERIDYEARWARIDRKIEFLVENHAQVESDLRQLIRIFGRHLEDGHGGEIDS